MKKFLLPSFLIALLTFQNCSKQDDLAYVDRADIISQSTADPSDYLCGTPTVVELVAGQHIYSGQVVIGNDADSLYVIYSADVDWSISEIHVYAGDPLLAPTNPSGVPVPGAFTHVIEFDIPVKNYVVSFPLADFTSECYAIFAHASVSNGVSNETAWSNNVGTNFVEGDASSAWSNGTSFADLTGTKRWGGYTEYCTQTCIDDPVDPEPSCFNEETAWSYGNSFEDLTGTNRWGWYSSHTLGATEEYLIYAGQHIECGVLTITDDGQTLYVTAQMTNDAYANYLHLYVGSEQEMVSLFNNSGTPVPGHFPIHMDQPESYAFSYSVPLAELTYIDEIIVAAHFEAMVPCP